MKVNFTNKTIQMSVAESKKAGRVGSEEYNTLVEFQKSFPGYRIDIIKKQLKNSKASHLTYSRMESYIKDHDEDGSILKEFLNMRNCNNDLDVEKKSYGAIKKWFFETYPCVKVALVK